MTFFPPLMPIIFLVLLLLPIQMQPRQLKVLAFFLWLIGGVALATLGFSRMAAAPEGHDITTVVLVTIISVIIGIAKGRFILSKTSARNIERLDTMQGTHRPIFVYSKRSWIVIGVMVLISVGLNLSAAPLLWRGAVNLAIGFGLVISSLAYIRSLKSQPAA